LPWFAKIELLTIISQVNNVNLRGASHGDAAQALKNANGNVTLVLQHRPDGSFLFRSSKRFTPNEGQQAN
jgi:hypothetical protein